MVAFRLCYERWAINPNNNYGEGPLFRVHLGAEERPLLWILAPMNHFDVGNLQDEMGLQREGREPHPYFKRAILRYAIQHIEQGLREKRFPIPPTDHPYELPMGKTEFPSLRQLLQEKTCTYQIRQGRDLLCAVASPNDPTCRGQIGLQTLAPTYRVLCRTCKLPDTDYVCSHLMHPEVLGRADRGRLLGRELLGALCDLGKAAIQNPAQCHAGGHTCWERLVEPELARPVIPVSPLTLPEAFDYLDAYWRLAFGKKQTLVRPKSLTGVATLSLPCATREELSTRLSALVDVLNSLYIPNERLPEPSKVKVEPGTLNRLQACLQECLDAAEHPACEHAITALRAVIDLRNWFQHGATARDLPRVCSHLSLPYPLPAPGETWERLRVTVTEALRVIREAIRRHADSGTGAPL